MKHTFRLTAQLVAVTLVLGLYGSAVFADGTETSAFDQVLEHYEPARLALAEDSMEGVAERGRKMGDVLNRLTTDWSIEAAGIQAEMGDEIQQLLPALKESATDLAEAESLTDARNAFYELSKGLVRWRKAANGDKPVVAYCSMAKRSWLQPAGELGNPYYGQSMPRCGEVVDG